MCPARIVKNYEDMGNGKECSPREILNHSLIQNLQSCPYPIYVDPLDPLSLFDGCSIQNRGEAKVAEDFEARPDPQAGKDKHFPAPKY